MPRKLPPKEKRFKPGTSGNPSGRPKLPEDIVRARTLNQLELERIVNRYLYLTRDELKARIADPATPMMEMMVASIIAQAASKGDQQRLEFILSRLLGRVQQHIEVSTPTPFVLKRRNGEEIVMGVSDDLGAAFGGSVGSDVRDSNGPKAPAK